MQLVQNTNATNFLPAKDMYLEGTDCSPCACCVEPDQPPCPGRPGTRELGQWPPGVAVMLSVVECRYIAVTDSHPKDVHENVASVAKEMPQLAPVRDEPRLFPQLAHGRSDDSFARVHSASGEIPAQGLPGISRTTSDTEDVPPGVEHQYDCGLLHLREADWM